MKPNPDGSYPEPVDPLSAEAMHAIGLPTPGHPLPRPQVTGPKTRAGKERSRANAVKHGMRCKVVEPTDQAEKIAQRIEEWTGALQPADTVQFWLVARAATASVRLDRCTERENIALEENTARAERDFFRRRRAWARRTGHKLQKDPKKAFAKLNGSAFGCDWLIDRWDQLAADLEITGGYWSRAEFLHALLMLGYDYDRIPPGEPTVSNLYLASLAADRAPDPEEVEAFLGLDTNTLDSEPRAAAHRQALGTREDGRQFLLAFVREEQARLRKLRDELWGAVDRSALEQACAHARTFDACPEAALARRYEASVSLELHRNLNGFYRARRESEKYQEDAPMRSVPAPNELHNGQDRVAIQETSVTSESPPAASPASPERPQGVAEARSERSQGVAEASPKHREGVSDRDRKAARKAAREAKRRSRRKGR